MITYREVKGKLVLRKNGVYFALTPEELDELEAVVLDIRSGTRAHYKEDARRDA